MNIKINSIKNKLIIYFTIFIVIICSVLWLVQTAFLNIYYDKMLSNEIKDLGEEIKQIQKTVILDEIAFKNSVNILIFDVYKNIKYNSTNSEIPFYVNLDEIINKIKNSKSQNILFNVKLNEFDLEGIVYASYNNGRYYLITANIDPIDSVVKILSNQLIITTIIIIIVSVIISVYISKKLTNSIIDITKSAKELGKGNYDVKFKLTQYEELNTLSNTLNYSAEELKKTDKLRKELIANVSHDIKTPITIIKSYAEMIKDLSGSNKVKREKDLTVIINQTDLLNKMVDDMMDLSRLENKIIKLNISEYDIIKSVNSIIDGFKSFKEYKFKTNFDLKQIIVIADEVKINQVINNLISNAINFVGEDKTVYINIIKINDKVKIEIKDNGKGIKDISKVFDRYYKSNDKYRKSGYGSGLGLSIVKNILELHKVKYGVESKVDEGTTFYIYLNCK